MCGNMTLTPEEKDVATALFRKEIKRLSLLKPPETDRITQLDGIAQKFGLWRRP